MNPISYVDLTLTSAGMVYLKTQALRLCTYAGQNLLAVGTPEAVKFYDAEEIIRGLHGSASELDLPLPEPVDVQIMAEFDPLGQRFLYEYVLGAEQGYLKTLVPDGHPLLILDKAASLGFIVQKPSTVKLLEADIRDKTAAGLRARLLSDKAEDLVRDYVAEPDPTAAQEEVVCGVVRKASPAVFERISRNAGGYSPSTTRVKWPFNTMQVGDCVYIDAKLAKRAQTAVHVYAARVGRTFRTTTNKVTRVLQVVRVEDPTDM